MIRYPKGSKAVEKTIKKTKKVQSLVTNTYKNRGMSFEQEINASNAYYRSIQRAIITKRPTPINVVKVDYASGAKITQAYFEKQSTTDYNGIYQGRYVDFEAKSTQSATSFPLANITAHQLQHLRDILDHGGLAFFIVHFVKKDEIYVVKAEHILWYINSEKRQSIPYDWIKEKGAIVRVDVQPRLRYLDAVDTLFF
jgi:recombination protein U